MMRHHPQRVHAKARQCGAMFSRVDSMGSKRDSVARDRQTGKNIRSYCRPGEAGITECLGSGMGASPFAARHRMALRVSVSAASATEKLSAADASAPGAVFAL